MSKISSFTAADVSVPVKIMHDGGLMLSLVEHKHVLLRHLQLCPTNKCNLNCAFCSCGDRDKNVEMSFTDIIKLLDNARALGCQAITITGGGEPLLHPDINDIINACFGRFIKVGLVTNGMALANLDPDTPVDWCRISFDSHRPFKPLAKILNRYLKKRKVATDWAFSFVAYDGVGDLRKVVRYANHQDFTHVRVVGDILNPTEEVMTHCRNALHGFDKKVIYQPRTTLTRGREKCLISLLKPTVAADGNIYPCCGAQYAIRGGKDRKSLVNRDFCKRMSMGKDLTDVCKNQKYFNGSICDVCYYDNYNKFLGMLTEDIKHKEWV